MRYFPIHFIQIRINDQCKVIFKRVCDRFVNILFFIIRVIVQIWNHK